jgi:acyl-CoA synthetase (AMP-forming)/AMP-acid ligase II
MVTVDAIRRIWPAASPFEEAEDAVTPACDENIAEAVVIGLPHARWTEAVTAIVVPAAGTQVDEAELLRRVRERLAGFKVPKAIAADELPKTSTGKIQKNVLRDRYARHYDQD